MPFEPISPDTPPLLPKAIDPVATPPSEPIAPVAASAAADVVPPRLKFVLPETKKKDESFIERYATSIKRIGRSIAHMGLGKMQTMFVQNMSVMLGAGIPVLDALNTLHADSRQRQTKNIIGRVITDVTGGSPLWRAMQNQEFLTPYALALVRVGEETGALARNMQHLAIQQEKDRMLRQKVKTAMIYPTIVLALTFIVMIILGWFVLPQLVGVLTSLNVELPFVTRVIIWIANFFTNYGVVAVPSFVFVCIVIFMVCKFTPLRGPTQQLFFAMPGFGPMARAATVGRFGIILGSMMKAGIPPVDAIRYMADVTEIIAYKRFYLRMAERIDRGQSFDQCFHDLKGARRLIPLPAQQLVTTGEKSGQVSEMLLKIAEIYEKNAEEAAQKLPLVLEPLLLVFIASLVGVIAFAILVPIYSIVGTLSK